jgi:hypothetical protein
MHPSYFPVLLWSIVIFISFLGYGEALRRALRRPEFDDLGWGLTAAWGMAVTLAICGLLMVFKLAIAPLLAVFVGVGAFAAIVQGVGRLVLRPLALSSLRIPFSDVVLYSLAAIAFASSVAWPHQIDPNDDLVCYLMLPVKILATGTLIEPFSFQRAGTFGGQAILQALVMIVGAERNGHVPDRGMAMLMIFGMLLHATRGLKGQYAFARFLLLFAFWFVPVPRISTNGAMTGGAMLLALLVTLDRCFSARSRDWTCYVPSGFLLAATCSIRPTFAMAAAFLLTSLAARDLALGGRHTKNEPGMLSPYILTALIGFVVLIPFMLVLYASNGTPMVPPFSGYVSKAYQTYAFNEPLRDAAAVVAFFVAPESLSILSLIAVSGFLPGSSRSRVLSVALVLATCVVLHRFSAVAFLDMYRYVYPILVPLGLWMLTEAIQRFSRLRSAQSIHDPISGDIAAVTASILVFIVVNAPSGANELRAQITGLPDQIDEVRPFFDHTVHEAYLELQSRVPAGDTILTMVDASFWFDFKRNPIYSINAVGGSSPPPGLPFEKGPEAVVAYLRTLGIRYIIAVDFNNAVLLYTRKLWTQTTRPEWFYQKLWKPRFNDFMDNIDALANGGGTLVARAGNLRLIDIGR